MEKMRMESVDMTAQNIDKIAELFPNCITEALDEEHSTTEQKVYKKVVNFELLKQMLSGEVLDGDEAYEFTWVGKKAAIVEANKPIRKTLRPCPKESVAWDTTKNLYIEGDKVLVLRTDTLDHSGQIGLILYNDTEATLKKVEYAEGEEWMRLVPVNPEYEPRLIRGEALAHCRVLGVPRLLIRELGGL